jgi:protein-L-isoaspartate(D-aspartate) O-methyltransferase
MSLINELINSGRLKTSELIKAFKTVERRDFLRPEDSGREEINAPLDIGYGQTISQPETVVFMLEKLQPESGEKILDVGCGSGWTTALLAEAVGDKGKVYAIERIPDLKKFAEANINKYDYIKNGTVYIICSDGFYGLPEFSPFDKILVSAASEEIPSELIKELKIGGRLVMPVGKKSVSQSITAMDKISEAEFKKREYPGFIFVPLIKND